MACHAGTSRFRRPVSPPSTTARALQARRAWRRTDAVNRPASRTFVSGLELNLKKGPNMPLYEHIFMARQDVTSQQVEAMVDTYKGIIEQNGGKVDKTEMWGVKSLAYRIRKN